MLQRLRDLRVNSLRRWKEFADEELPSHSPMDDLGFALFARKRERKRNLMT